MLRITVSKSIGTSAYWAAPTRPMTPPSRTAPMDISIASRVPTHSSTVRVPSPPVSYRTRSPNAS
jgi:hypothetical protein